MLWCKNLAKTNLLSLFSCMSTPPSSIFVLHMENIWCLTLPHPHQTLEKIWNVSSIKELEPYFLHIWLHFASEIPATSSNHRNKRCTRKITDAHRVPSTLYQTRLFQTSFFPVDQKMVASLSNYLWFTSREFEVGCFSWGEKNLCFENSFAHSGPTEFQVTTLGQSGESTFLFP